jgi:hypothetical protein
VSKINSNIVWFPAQAATKLAAKRATRIAALSPQERADLADFQRLPLEEQQRQLDWLRIEQELQAHAANRAMQLAMPEEPAPPPGEVELQRIVQGFAVRRGVPAPKIVRVILNVGPVRYDDAQRDTGSEGDDAPPFTTKAFQPRPKLLLSTWLSREIYPDSLRKRDQGGCGGWKSGFLFRS